MQNTSLRCLMYAAESVWCVGSCQLCVGWTLHMLAGMLYPDLFSRLRVDSRDSQYDVEEQIWFKDLPFNSWSGKNIAPKITKDIDQGTLFPCKLNVVCFNTSPPLSSSTNFWLLATKRQYKPDYKKEPALQNPALNPLSLTQNLSQLPPRFRRHIDSETELVG